MKQENSLIIAYKNQVREAINRTNQMWGDNLTPSQKNYLEALEWNEKNCEKFLKNDEHNFKKSKKNFKKENNNEKSENILSSETDQ